MNANLKKRIISGDVKTLYWVKVHGETISIRKSKLIYVYTRKAPYKIDTDNVTKYHNKIFIDVYLEAAKGEPDYDIQIHLYDREFDQLFESIEQGIKRHIKNKEKEIKRLQRHIRTYKARLNEWLSRA